MMTYTEMLNVEAAYKRREGEKQEQETMTEYMRGKAASDRLWSDPREPWNGLDPWLIFHLCPKCGEMEVAEQHRDRERKAELSGNNWSCPNCEWNRKSEMPEMVAGLVLLGQLRAGLRSWREGHSMKTWSNVEA